MELHWEALRDLSLVADSASQAPAPTPPLQKTALHQQPRPHDAIRQQRRWAPRSTTARHTDSAHAMRHREPIPTTMRLPHANDEMLRRVFLYRAVSATLRFRGGKH